MLNLVFHPGTWELWRNLARSPTTITFALSASAPGWAWPKRAWPEG